jgi:site-specific recombinase XerD
MKLEATMKIDMLPRDRRDQRKCSHTSLVTAEVAMSEPIGQDSGYRGIYNLIRDLSHIAGLAEPVHPHQLRHTFGTQLLLEGVDPEFVRNLMRIKSPQVFERYTKRALDEKASDRFRESIKSSASGLFSQG